MEPFGPYYSLQVRLGHIRHVDHQVTNAVSAVGQAAPLGSTAATLLAVDDVGGRGGLAGSLALDQAGVVVLPRPRVLLDDAALLVGDGGEAAAGLLDDVEVAQQKDHRHRHDGQNDQGGEDDDGPGGVFQFQHLSLEDRREKIWSAEVILFSFDPFVTLIYNRGSYFLCRATWGFKS